MDEIGYKNPHGQRSGQFDDRFKGDGRHEALVSFGCVQVTGAEQNGKYGQQQGNIKRGVAHNRNLGKME